MQHSLFQTAFWVGLSLLAGACSRSKVKSDLVQAAPAPPLIQLETSPCRGYCPVYRVLFRANGVAEYEGERFVEKIGRDSFRLTASELVQLRKAVETTNLWQYPNEFPVTIADAPGASLTVYRNSEQKTVRGSMERPKPIRDLDELLRQLTRAHGINLDSKDPNALPEGAQSELLVKLKPGLNAGNWLRDFNQGGSEVQLKLVRRTGGTGDNIWVVGYDRRKIEEKTLLDLLKTTDGVLEAQPNRQAQERH